LSERLYHVANSAMVGERFRACLLHARNTGRYTIALQAAKWIVEELERTPLEFGESRENYPGAKLQLRIGFARPLKVRFGVHEESKTVFIRTIELMD
jgi:hypothetical protein